MCDIIARTEASFVVSVKCRRAMQQHAVCDSPYSLWNPSDLLLRLRSVLALLKLLVQGHQDAFSVCISQQHRTLPRIRVDAGTAIEDVAG